VAELGFRLCPSPPNPPNPKGEFSRNLRRSNAGQTLPLSRGSTYLADEGMGRKFLVDSKLFMGSTHS
jgi:hypothetical protein